jgi:hypothetical protein
MESDLSVVTSEIDSMPLKVELLRNLIHVTPSTGSGQALNEVRGLLTLVELSSRRFFAEFTLSAGRRLFASLRVTASEGLRMTRGGFFNSPRLA